MRSSYLLTVALSAVAYAIPIATQNSVAGSNGALQFKPRQYLSPAGKFVEKREDEIKVEAKIPGFVGAEVEVEEDEIEVEAEVLGVKAKVEIEDKAN